LACFAPESLAYFAPEWWPTLVRNTHPINFLNMKRVNTRGIRQANKHVLMAALCYNLKKYMKFQGRSVLAAVQTSGLKGTETISAFLEPFLTQ
jgi:hypothetical protein